MVLDQDGVDCGRGCEAPCKLHWQKTPLFKPDEPVSVAMIGAALILIALASGVTYVLLKKVFPKYGL